MIRNGMVGGFGSMAQRDMIDLGAEAVAQDQADAVISGRHPAGRHEQAHEEGKTDKREPKAARLPSIPDHPPCHRARLRPSNTPVD
jgi:hypothetical protein